MCFGPMKREAGGSPARTRRCKEGALFPKVLDCLLFYAIAAQNSQSLAMSLKKGRLPPALRRRNKVLRAKSEDLPISVL